MCNRARYAGEPKTLWGSAAKLFSERPRYNRFNPTELRPKSRNYVVREQEGDRFWDVMTWDVLGGHALADKPSGCVIWICVTFYLEIGPFGWFGGEPGKPLRDLAGFTSPKRIGRNKDGDRPLRANHSKVPARHFTRIGSIDAMLETLFGPLPTESPPIVGDEVAGDS